VSSVIVPAAAFACGPGDEGRKPVGISVTTTVNGADVTAQVLCGEDAAQAAARVATHKKSRTNDGEVVLQIAKELHGLLTREAETGDIGYLPPKVLDPGTERERPRQLQTGGQYSRRASEHAKKDDYVEAVADLLRALLRPNVDETARDKLMSTMENFLQKAEKRSAKMAKDGDLSDLFDAFDLEDDGKDNKEIDRSVLKKLYRELSVKYHPDKNPDAAQRFNNIRDAYEILSDPVKTLLFDTGGMDLVRKYEGGSDDLERTDNNEVRLHVDLKDVYTGTSRTVMNSRRIVCRSCRLHPELPRCKQCKRCPGEVRQRQRWLNQHQYTVEEYEIPSNEKCMQDKAPVEVAIEKGMLGGDRINHPGMASQLPKEIPGDLLVSVSVKEHPLFKRIGNDLLVVVHVSLYEALLGFRREIVHLDGHKVAFGVERGAVLKPGSGLEIADEGMPLREDPSSYGKLIVKFAVDFPEEVDDKSAAALEEAFRTMGLGPRPLQVTPSSAGAKGSHRRNEL